MTGMTIIDWIVLVWWSLLLTTCVFLYFRGDIRWLKTMNDELFKRVSDLEIKLIQQGSLRP